MTEITIHYNDHQITAWLRGLLSVAWADGNFDPQEQEFISNLTHSELVSNNNLGELTPISPEELATVLGHDHEIKENFLRTAVMMAIADGIYTEAESQILHNFQMALGLNIEALKSLEKTLCIIEQQASDTTNYLQHPEHHPDLLNPIKHWLDDLQVKDARLARFMCKMIPPQCPFERDIKLFGHKIIHIPPMCKLNPLYDQLVGLRFRSLSYLADECKEDISKYI